MSTKINEIIKESLSELKSENRAFTPSNYLEVFCKVAKKKGVLVEDCRQVEHYLDKLDPMLKKDAKSFNVRTMDELFAFLNSRLSRSKPSESAALIGALTLLTKRLLQSISLLHNKKAKDLASSSLGRIERFQDIKSIELIKDKWFDFVTNYDDKFLKKLESYCKIKVFDLEEMIDNIVRCFSDGGEKEIYESLAPLIIATLTPSIASSINDELATISYELKSSPEILSSEAVHEDIKKFIKKRIELDKKEVDLKVEEIDKILSEIGKRLIKLIETSNVSGEQIVSIRQELQDIDFSKGTFETIQGKLINLASSLEHETGALSSKMQKNKETIRKLQHRVNKLESALIETKKESKEDFLTKLSTRRSLDEELSRAEEAFKRYKIDYSICFLDLDHFKVINDTYGHEAGDTILAAVGRILKRFTRQVDIVGRYGGEEFLIVLPNVDLVNAVSVADKIRETIKGFKFLYKNERINVSVSAGVSERKQNNSRKETLVSADDMLYEAKKAGRDRVYPKV